MDKLLQRNLDLLLSQITSSLDFSPTDAKTFLDNFLVVYSVPPQSGLDEEIEIVRDSKGDIITTTSLKIPNLRFKLGELLIEIYRLVVMSSVSKNNPNRLLLVGLDFLRRVRQLGTITISERHARLLIAIYQLNQTETKVTVDAVHELLGVDRKDNSIADGLTELEHLKCIKLNKGQIQLNETIDIVRKDK